MTIGVSSKQLSSDGTKRGLHPNSLKNLRPGNPPLDRGMNDGYSVKSRVKDLLKEQSDFIPPMANPSDKNYRDQIARVIVKKSACGDVPMISKLLELTGDTEPEKQGGITINADKVIVDARGKIAELLERRAGVLNGDG